MPQRFEDLSLGTGLEINHEEPAEFYCYAPTNPLQSSFRVNLANIFPRNQGEQCIKSNEDVKQTFGGATGETNNAIHNARYSTVKGIRKGSRAVSTSSSRRFSPTSTV